MRADHAHFVAVRCTKWVWSALNAQNFRGSRDLGHASFFKKLRVMSGLCLETRTPNLKSVALTVLELLGFNDQNLAVNLAPPLFGIF